MCIICVQLFWLAKVRNYKYLQPLHSTKKPSAPGALACCGSCTCRSRAVSAEISLFTKGSCISVEACKLFWLLLSHSSLKPLRGLFKSFCARAYWLLFMHLKENLTLKHTQYFRAEIFLWEVRGCLQHWHHRWTSLARLQGCVIGETLSTWERELLVRTYHFPGTFFQKRQWEIRPKILDTTKVGLRVAKSKYRWETVTKWWLISLVSPPAGIWTSLVI